MRISRLLIMLTTGTFCITGNWQVVPVPAGGWSTGGAAWAQGNQGCQGYLMQGQPDGGYRPPVSAPNMMQTGAYPPQMQAQPGYPSAGWGNQYSPSAPAQIPGTAPVQAMGQPFASRAGTPPAAPGKAMTLAQWFHYYDQIRHQAQMSGSERLRADGLLSRGLSVLMPGEEKASTSALLNSMVQRYETACNQLRALPQLGQTANLHHAYYNYFATAGQLFADYVRVQNNLFITDAQTGQPLASSLLQRKQMLEGLEHQCKMLDTQTRQQYGIAPYPW
jgi:hypothetical protein